MLRLVKELRGNAKKKKKRKNETYKTPLAGSLHGSKGDERTTHKSFLEEKKLACGLCGKPSQLEGIRRLIEALASRNMKDPVPPKLYGS